MPRVRSVARLQRAVCHKAHSISLELIMDAETRKMVTLAAETRELVKNVLANLDVLERFIAGGGGKAHAVKAYLTFFDDLWTARYGERYIFAGGKDAAGAKKLLNSLEKTDLGHRTRAYLASNDEFYVKQRHPFGSLVRDINKFGARLIDPPVRASSARECQHHPICASDIEHTRRRAEDMRHV